MDEDSGVVIVNVAKSAKESISFPRRVWNYLKESKSIQRRVWNYLIDKDNPMRIWEPLGNILMGLGAFVAIGVLSFLSAPLPWAPKDKAGRHYVPFELVFMKNAIKDEQKGISYGIMRLKIDSAEIAKYNSGDSTMVRLVQTALEKRVSDAAAHKAEAVRAAKAQKEQGKSKAKKGKKSGAVLFQNPMEIMAFKAMGGNPSQKTFVVPTAARKIA
ncbi:MAG: hypothetical protein WC861_01985 [Candidatus Micrarchaeia archaeon]